MLAALRFCCCYKMATSTLWKQISILFFILCLTLSSGDSGLELVDDNEFINLCQTEKYVIALFTKDNCEECDNTENELISIREDLVDDLGAWVVKIRSSNLVQIYSPSREPALVFVRHGVPLLYHGEVNDELILHTFRENKEPGVRELDDSNFESLTQAATGATTGDWFILFYSKTCVTSHRLAARWEAVAAALKTRMNVARINRLEGGSVTARRFKVYNTPTFILFRLGNMYRYDLPSHEVANLVHFATDGFKKLARSERVPVPKSPFDDLTQMIADYLAENPWVLGVGGLAIMIGCWLGMRARLQKPKPKRKEKKEKDATESSSKSIKKTK